MNKDADSAKIKQVISEFVFRGGNLLTDEHLLYHELACLGFEKQQIQEIIEWFVEFSLSSDIIDIADFYREIKGNMRILSKQESMYVPKPLFELLIKFQQKGLWDQMCFESIMNKLYLLNANEMNQDDVTSFIILDLVNQYRITWQEKMTKLYAANRTVIH